MVTSVVVADLDLCEQNKTAEHQIREKLTNWSGTHACSPKQVHRPTCTSEVAQIVSSCHEHGIPLRVVGSGLSPNGIAFPDRDEAHVVCLEGCNRVLKVDKKNMLVEVQAGIQVGELLEELREHGMTLENLGSINLQQIGGFVQAGVHGTGATIPPVEEQVVRMKIVTPGRGEVVLSANDPDPTAFDLARVGLGCLGVVTEVTLRCVAAHQLTETVEVMTREGVRKGHVDRLRDNRHVRYMWIPYVDAVVVVSSNYTENGATTVPDDGDDDDDDEACQASLIPLKKLLRECAPAQDIPVSIGFAELRDKLLSSGAGPLDTDHVVLVNQAESEYWHRHAQTHIPRPQDSDAVLAFDCGGQQWVWEVAMPVRHGTLCDLDFVQRVLEETEAARLPAPAPIEQRWTRGSSAAMSPAGPNKRLDVRAGLFSWVGIIMYMPTSDDNERAAITRAFQRYCDLVQRVGSQMVVSGELEWDLQTHWAKLEVADSGPRSAANVRQRLCNRYPVDEFNAMRRAYDPKGIMQSNKIKTWFGE